MAPWRLWSTSNALFLLCGILTAPAHAAQASAAATELASPDYAAVSASDPADLADEQMRPSVGPALAVDTGARGLDLALHRLATRASLLMIVAHPDDEDGGMLTYESRGAGARVGVLTLTRGEGGQNLMSADFNDALGLVRTRELLAADRYFATDQMFGTEVDFGFSKTIEESFAQWTHQRVLYDAVRAVRLYRPLVLTSVFVGAPTDGHGQHQVSGEITQEVFSAAADPKVFPEMGLPPWAPLKVYARVPFAQIDTRGMFDYATSKWVPTRFENYVTGKISTTAPTADVTIPEGTFSNTLKMSYVQFAREGLALQRSQIGSASRPAPAGAFDVGYTRYASRVPVTSPEKTFFDGIDVSLVGMANLAANPPALLVRQLRDLSTVVDAAIAASNQADSTRVAPLLREGLLQTDRLLDEIPHAETLSDSERFNLLHELRIKRVQFNDALGLALGLTLRAITATPPSSATDAIPDALTPGEPITVHVDLAHAGTEPLSLTRVILRQELQTDKRWITTSDTSAAQSAGMPLPATYEVDAHAIVPEDARGQRPPFFRDNVEQPYYTVPDPALRNAPTAPPAFVVMAQVQYGAATVVLEQAAGQPIAGVFQPATVVPPVNVSLSPEVAIVAQTAKTFQVKGSVVQAAPPRAGSLALETPPAWSSAPHTFSWSSADPHETTNYQITPEKLGDAAHELHAIASVSGKQFHESFHAVGYPGIIRDVSYEPARTRVQGIDLRLPAGLRVAYLPGTGDTVEAALRTMGINPERLTVTDIAAGHLTGFDAVVLGVRAYAAHADLAAATPQLLAYARAGGTVVVQYNTVEYTAADAPFPLSLGTNERVVEERDPVQLLDPETQVLRWPNRLTERDFDGWIEERGHGFMGQWASEYSAPTEVHDPGEDPQRGGLLIAPVGKGHYVYCAFALYRQLPEGVPGAYRLLANLISIGRHP